MAYRFRVDDGGKLVLQVYEPPKYSPYYSAHEQEGTWRDATVGDIPVTDPFARERIDRDWPKGNTFMYAEPSHD